MSHAVRALLTAGEIATLRTPQYVRGSWQKPKLSAKGCAMLRKRMLLAGKEWPFPDKTQPNKPLSAPSEITAWERFQKTPRWPGKLAKYQKDRRELIAKSLPTIDAVVAKERKLIEKEKKRVEERAKIGASALFPEGKWRNKPGGFQ